jgi:hypothetical protein
MFWVVTGVLSIIVAAQIGLFIRLRADAAAGTVVSRVLNAGLPLSPGDASVIVYPAGRRDAPVARGDAGRSIRVPEGSYDIQVLYTRSHDRQENWLENVNVTRGIRTARDVEFSAGQLAVTAFAGSREALATDGLVQVLALGNSSQVITSFLPGEIATVRAGTYDLRVALLEDAREKAVQWLRGVTVTPGLLTSSAATFLQGRLLISATNAGKPVASESVALSVYNAGDAQEEVVESGLAGVPIALAPGRYDVKATFTQAHDSPSVWIRDVEIADGETAERRVGFSAGTLRIKAFMRGGAELVNFQAYVYFYKTSDHQEPVTYVPAGEPVVLSAGRYDVRVNFFRSHDRPDLWLRDLDLPPGATRVEQLNFPSGKLLVRASDSEGKELTGDNVFVYFYKTGAGERSTPVAQARGGEEVVLTAGTYDVRAVDSRGFGDEWQKEVEVVSGQQRQTALVFLRRTR